MSVSRVVLPVLNLEQNDNPLKKVVLKGAKNYVAQRIAPDSQSASGVTFTIVPPSQNTVIDRRIDIEYEILISAEGATTWTPAFSASTDAQSLASTYGFKSSQYHDYESTSGVAFPDLGALAITPSAVAFTTQTDPTEVQVKAGALPAGVLSGTHAQFTGANLIVGLNTVINNAVNASLANANTAIPGLVNTATLAGAGSINAFANQSQTQQNSRLLKSLHNNIGLRQLPISSVVDNISVNINGQHISSELKRIVHPLLQYTSCEYRENALVGVAHHPDMSGRLDDPMRNQSNVDYPSGNQLSLAVGGVRDGETPNGVFFNNDNCEVILANGNVVPIVAGYSSGAGGSLKLRIREPINLSPFLLHFGEGMTNVNQLQITINFDEARISRILEYFAITPFKDSTTPPTAPVVTFNGINTARACVKYYQPQDDIKIPNEIVLPYFQPVVYQSQQVGIPLAVYSIGSNGDDAVSLSAQIVGQTRRLNQIPDALYIWCRRNHQDLRSNDADFFTDIRNINISWGNQTGILSNHTSKQLLDLAKDNGCDIKSVSEKQNRGYCLKLIFGKDIPLMNNESPGTRGDYSIQITTTYASKYGNAGADGQRYVGYEMYVNAGNCVIAPNECRIQTGLLDLKDNVSAEDMGDKWHNNDVMSGGGLFSGIMNFAKKIPSFVKKVAPHIINNLPQIMETGQNVMDLAGKARDAVGGSPMGGSMMGGSRMGGSPMGGSAMGGRMNSRRRY